MVNRKIVNEPMANEKEMTHEQGMTFLSALIALIYNFVKSFKKTKE